MMVRILASYGGYFWQYEAEDGTHYTGPIKKLGLGKHRKKWWKR